MAKFAAQPRMEVAVSTFGYTEESVEFATHISDIVSVNRIDQPCHAVSTCHYRSSPFKRYR
jgi:hypothetical protein